MVIHRWVPESGGGSAEAAAGNDAGKGQKETGWIIFLSFIVFNANVVL